MFLLFHSYLPPLAESQLNPNEISFRPNLLRKSLFVGKRFYFLTANQVCVNCDILVKYFKWIFLRYFNRLIEN